MENNSRIKAKFKRIKYIKLKIKIHNLKENVKITEINVNSHKKNIDRDLNIFKKYKEITLFIR